MLIFIELWLLCFSQIPQSQFFPLLLSLRLRCRSVLSWRCYCLSRVQLLTSTMFVSTLQLLVLSPLTRPNSAIVYVFQFPVLWEPGWLAQLKSTFFFLSFFLVLSPSWQDEFCDWLCPRLPVLWEPCWKAQNLMFKMIFSLSYLSAYYIDHQFESSQVLDYLGAFSFMPLSSFADYWFS